MSLVRHHLNARRELKVLAALAPITQAELDFDNELAEWLAAREADYQF